MSGYIAEQAPAVRPVLRRLRAIIRRALPRATEVISYGIPAYRIDGRVVIYIAGWKAHYSIYPATRQLVETYADELAPYETSGKGTIRFPLTAPVPARLIATLARFRAREVAEARAARGKRRASPAHGRP